LHTQKHNELKQRLRILKPSGNRKLISILSGALRLSKCVSEGS
jgi:predicted protein tyrosine phosphatase